MRRALALLVLVPLRVGAQELTPLGLTPTLMAQTDYVDHAAEAERDNGFELQRLRLGLRAQPVPWFTAVGSLEYSDGEVKPFEIYADVAVATSWHFSVGFRRTPLFHSAKDELIESMPVPELSLPVRAMWPGVDLGAEVHYTPEKVPVEAWLRVGDGSQSVAGNDDDHLAYDGRVDLVLGRARPGGLGGWGLRLGVGGHAKYREETSGLSDTTPDGFLFFHPQPTNGWQVITEGHAAVWWQRLSVSLEGGWAREGRAKEVFANGAEISATQAPIFTRGAALEIAAMIWGTPRMPGRSGVPGIWPGDPSFSFETWHGGSIEVAARLERVDLEYGAPDVAPGGAQGGSVALDWWATSFAALNVGFYDYQYFRAPIEEPNQTQFWLVMARSTVSFR